MKQMDYFFGIRFGSYIIIFVVLMTTIFKNDDPKIIISTMVLYLIPISVDYFGHIPVEEQNQRRKNLAMWTSIGLTVICLSLLLSDFRLVGIINHLITKLFFCAFASFYVFIAGIDWVTYSTEKEVRHREKIRQASLEQQRIFRMEERVKSNQQILKHTGDSAQ